MNSSFPLEYIFDRSTGDEKFGIVLSCEYFLQQVPSNHNDNLHVGDEVLKVKIRRSTSPLSTSLVQINEIPIEDLSLEEAQRLIDSTKDQLILHTKPRGKEKKKKKNSSKALHSNYYPHHFNGSNSYSTLRTLKRSNSEKRCISFSTDGSNIGIRLVGGNKYGLFIGEIQKNSLAEQAGLAVADKIFNVTSPKRTWARFSRPAVRFVFRSISLILRMSRAKKRFYI